MKAFLVSWLMLMAINGNGAPPDCKVIMEKAQGYFNEGNYHACILEANKVSCRNERERAKVLLIQCYLELRKPSDSILLEVKKLLRINPEFDGDVSIAFGNRLQKFKRYPRFIGSAQSLISFAWPRKLLSEPIFVDQEKISEYEFAPQVSFALSLEYAVLPRLSLASDYVLSRYRYSRKVEFENSAALLYHENLNYHSFPIYFKFYISPRILKERVRGFHIEFGYVPSYLSKATGNIQSEQSSEDFIDRSTARAHITHGVSAGAGLRVAEFFSKRFVLQAKARLTYGLNSVNSVVNRYDNASLTQGYYYSDDSMRIMSLEFFGSLNYKISYNLHQYK
jgi:hypothetical protein